MAFMKAHEPYQRPAPLEGGIKRRADARRIYGEIVTEMSGIEDKDTLEIFLITVAEPLIQFEAELPFFWDGDGQDFIGLDQEIKRAWRRCTAEW
jgi:hypothetical protein